MWTSIFCNFRSSKELEIYKEQEEEEEEVYKEPKITRNQKSKLANEGSGFELKETKWTESETLEVD